jgi:hypothetical protein
MNLSTSRVQRLVPAVWTGFTPLGELAAWKGDHLKRSCPEG